MWKRIPKLERVFLACVISAVLLLVGIAAWSSISFNVKISRLKRMGEPVVQQIEAYRDRHGTYPKSLEEANIRTVKTKYGAFRYRKRDANGRECFDLTVGDYSKHQFVLWWENCEGSGWRLDG